MFSSLTHKSISKLNFVRLDTFSLSWFISTDFDDCFRECICQSSGGYLSRKIEVFRYCWKRNDFQHSFYFGPSYITFIYQRGGNETRSLKANSSIVLYTETKLYRIFAIRSNVLPQNKHSCINFHTKLEIWKLLYG